MNWKELFTKDSNDMVIMKSKSDIELVCADKGIEKD
jgi:hypothetical protein